MTWRNGPDLSESLEIVHGDLVSSQVKKDVLKGTADDEARLVAGYVKHKQTYACPLERTNLSRLYHFEFLGLNFMNREKRTWATGAIPYRADVGELCHLHPGQLTCHRSAWVS